MKKKYKHFFIFIFTVINIFSEENINIGVSSPFIKNQDVNTIFIQKQFVFELLSNYSSNKYNLEINNAGIMDDEYQYIKNCKNEIEKNDNDYLLYSSVYTIDSHLIFKISLINIYDDNVILSKIFNNKIDLNINEILFSIANEIINSIDNKELIKIKKKKKKKDVSNSIQNFNNKIEEKKDFFHEVFILNGFLKNTPNTMSFFIWYIGYNFSPFRFFSIETSFFLGIRKY